ncbi:B- and T-lymphocyte attenuator [Ctenodactylus gundi]
MWNGGSKAGVPWLTARLHPLLEQTERRSPEAPQAGVRNAEAGSPSPSLRTKEERRRGREPRGAESCDVQIYIKRHSVHSVTAGTSFKLECPVKHCVGQPKVTWCKFSGKNCLHLKDSQHLRTSWKEGQNTSFFVLHFEPLLSSDNGSYRCSINLSSKLIESHSTFINVKGKQKKPPDMAGREINLVHALQPLGSERTEVSTRHSAQTSPSEAQIYENNPCFRTHEGCAICANPHLEESKHSIVYASLNHSVIGAKPRLTRAVKEAPTEYASVCVRS